jgi:hypothetical protein
MARKKSSGSNIGLILTLIFFVLATFITGTVAYFGYDEVEGLKAKAEQAKKAQLAAEAQYKEERVRKVLLRIALGVEDKEDRQLLVQELDPLRITVKNEYDRVKSGLDGKADLVTDPKDNQKKSPFYWPLLSMSASDLKNIATDADGAPKDPTALAADPATGPMYTVPGVINIFKAQAIAAEGKRREAEEKLAAAEKQVASTSSNKTEIEKKFLDNIDQLKKDDKAKHDKLAAEVKALQLKHAQDANDAIKRAADAAKVVLNKDDELKGLEDKVRKLDLRLKTQIATTNPSAARVDLLNLEEKKGEIIRKDEGGFVIINIGSAKKLKPQVTFLVVAADVSWLALQEKEKSLDRNTYRLDRQPYEENPYVKAGIEVVEILGPDRARAKIVFENEPIRNPVQVRDQIFNVAWQPAEEIRIAFAGIIDLDGDGLDNNEEFLRMLERQGVIVDEYMKMKPLKFVKRDDKGMSLQTRYLVIAPDPRFDALGKKSEQMEKILKEMNDIKTRAGEMGVQVIEARKFLAMIGFKLPRNPVAPQYGSSVYLDRAAPMAEPKKEGN